MSTLNAIEISFNPIAFVAEVGCLMLDLAVCDLVGDQASAEVYGNMVIALVAPTAAHVVNTNCWDYSIFLTSYPELKVFFDDAENLRSELEG